MAYASEYRKRNLKITTFTILLATIKELMSKTFNGPIVFGQVCDVPNDEYFFVQNGSTHKVFCHLHQGGSALEVTRRGDIVMKEVIVTPPATGDQVVIIRESEKPTERAFTKAKMWVHANVWEKVAWAINFHKRYRAIGYENRINGQPQEENNQEIILAEGQLIGIVMVNPYRTDGKDQLSEKYTSYLGTREYSYKVRWERLGPDGLWVKCTDPRPRHEVKF
jgi:hypothetical protein